jgi:hypothetical protein
VDHPAIRTANGRVIRSIDFYDDLAKQLQRRGVGRPYRSVWHRTSRLTSASLQVARLQKPIFMRQRIEGAVHRLPPKLMTVCAVLASLIPILWVSGIGSDVMKPIAAPMVGGMITSTIQVRILVPVFFVLMKERALRRGTFQPEPPE